MRNSIPLLTACFLLAECTCGYSQLELLFTAKCCNSFYPLDSIIIENLNSGSKITKYYPDTSLNLIVSKVDDVELPEEGRLRLNQNYPNPFNTETKFDIYLPEDDILTIRIYNVLGRMVSGYESLLPAGSHSFTFTGGEEQIFFIVAATSKYSAGIRMIKTGFVKQDLCPDLVHNGFNPGDDEDSEPNGTLKNSINEFEYRSGDSLMLIGYMTNDSNTVISDTIIERPDQSKTITFLFEKKHRILLLLYHVLTDSIPVNEYERNATDFDNDLKYIMGTGYQFLSINDLLLLQSGKMKLYSDGIIITFDDGNKTNYTKAFPLLSEYDIPATFFLIPERIGDTSYMTWPEVYQMSQYVNAEGVTPFIMGSHTSSHPYLEQSAQYFTDHQDYLNFLYTELEDSRAWIVDITGQENIFLSLPYGDGANNTDIINTAISCGYKGIRTSVYASFTADSMNIYALPCVSILSHYSIQIIEEFLNVW